MKGHGPGVNRGRSLDRRRVRCRIFAGREAEGIVPDVRVERAKVTAYDTSSRTSEADLIRHLDNANGGKSTKDSASKSNADGLLSTDNQLYEALTLLKGLNVLGLREHNNSQTKAADMANNGES